MTNLAANIASVLGGANYDSQFVEVAGSNVIAFEDETLMGFVCVFDTADELVKSWRDAEASLLARYAPNLRSAGEKAWNVYMCFLTADAANENLASAVRWIPENLERTRKLASVGVQTRADCENALLPLLPILSKPVLAVETTSERLRRRLRVIAPDVAETIMDDAASPDEIAAMLTGGGE